MTVSAIRCPWIPHTFKPYLDFLVAEQLYLCSISMTSLSGISWSWNKCWLSQHLTLTFTSQKGRDTNNSATMAQVHPQPQDMLQNRSCGCVNSSHPTPYCIYKCWLCLSGHTPTFNDRDELTPSLWVMLKMSFKMRSSSNASVRLNIKKP